MHTVTVQGTGNDTAHVAVEATDPEERLVLVTEPAMLDVASGATGTATIRSAAKSWLVVGPALRIPFTIDVTERSGARQTETALFEQRAFIPRWAIPIAGTVAALTVAVVVGASILKGPDPTGSPSAVTSAGVSAPSSGGPGGPTPSPSQSSGPTNSPAPTPTAEPSPTATIPGPTPTIPASGLTIRGRGTYPATFAEAYRSGAFLKIEITYAVQGDTCRLQIVLPGDAATGPQDVPTTATGGVACSLVRTNCVFRSGVVRLIRPDPNGSADTARGTFSVTASDQPFGGTELQLSGAFGDLVVARR
jgi:hypothetical protein